MGAFEINTLNLIEGDLPEKAKPMVRKWASKYQKELLQMWNTQQFIQLPPLE